MIEVKALTKFFGSKKAVDNVSFNVEKGEILGFLGPNGAGKSTTMRMVTAFLPPDSGTALVGGFNILTDSLSARKKIGYLPENAPVYPDMSVGSYLTFCAEIRGFSGADKKRRVEQTLEKCFLGKVRHQAINTLSKGFKQRVCFAQSILHDPEYLILDEPTDGLDPNQKHEVRLMIRRMAADKAIILSTHILDEMEAVCTRVVIISEGHVVADESPESLRSRSAAHGAVRLVLTNTPPNMEIGFLAQVKGVKSASVLESIDGACTIRVHPEQEDPLVTDRILTEVMNRKLTVHSVAVEQGRMDEVFRSLTT